MKIIGGEFQFKEEKGYTFLTDSGRSSLRLILKSIGTNKKISLPDFLCGVIVDVIKELKMPYSFYNVDERFAPQLKNKDFDILYLIDYFGKKNDLLRTLHLNNTFIIQDSVFLPWVDIPNDIKNWASFNSFRKISCLSDGSIVKSTLKLNQDLISPKAANFVSKKYEAKHIKYEYLQNKRYSQSAYLSIFKNAERMLDRQKKIYTISQKSLFNLFNFYRNAEAEYRIRRANRDILKSLLGHFAANITTEYPSFFILNVERRDQLRKYLISKNVFLPVHWPRVGKIRNVLYDRLISIPIDSRYNKNDMRRISSLVKDFYHK